MARSTFMYCAAGLLALAGQDTVAQDTPTEKSSDTPALQEVIVTAERREASLQNTAIAITALGTDVLTNTGVSHPEDLNKLVPGLGIAQGGSSTQIYVRGVGNYGTNALADPAVAFNMDGVYVGRFSGISGNFYDLARVEVLKGPQGTLYGRNATGGAINIVTNKPTQEFGVGANVDVGNYSLIRGGGFVNIPISDRLAMRVAAQYTDRDGYQSDGYDDDKSKSARVHLLFEPAEGTSILVSGLYTELGGNGPTEIPVTVNGYVNPDNPWEGSSITTPIALTGAVSPFAPPDLVINGVRRDDGFLDIKVKSITAELNQTLGFGTLTVVGNYMDTPNKSKSYGPGFLFQQDDTAKQKSAEVRLGGENGPLRWVGGLYYYAEDQTTLYWVDQGFLFNQVGDDLTALDDESKAVFSQVTYSLNDRLRLTGGVRYTDETKKQRGQYFYRESATIPCEALGTTRAFIPAISARIPFAATNGNGVAYPFSYCRDTQNGDLSFTDTSWKVGVDFDVRDDSMLYANVSRGFKAGGFFAAGDNTDVGNIFKPEHLTAFAAGAKNRFLDRRLQVNAEAFYWDYKDHQESYLAPTYSALNSFAFITQAADAEIYGLDAEVDALLSDYDVLSIKAQYLHAEYTDANFRLARPNTLPPSTVCTPTRSATNPQLFNVNCTGQQMPRSPDFSATVDYHHTFKLGNGGSIVPGLNAQYSSSYWSAVDYNPLQQQSSFTVWGADLTYESGKNWSLTAYGANLGDEDIYTNSFMYPATNVAMNSLRAPRTYGARLNVKF